MIKSFSIKYIITKTIEVYHISTLISIKRNKKKTNNKYITVIQFKKIQLL